MRPPSSSPAAVRRLTTPDPLPIIGAGRHEQLGATVHGDSTTFAVWAPDATRVQVCLFDGSGRQEDRLALTERTQGVWHGQIPGVTAGWQYGLRADGPDAPAAGCRFNARRLLVDPYARAVANVDSHYRSVVIDDRFDWGDDVHPRTPWHDSVIYEAHLRGLTMRHPQVPEHLRGTYAGLAHPAIIDELVRLGVTAVELLPVQQFFTEPAVGKRGLTNYWGYNTLAFCAPHGAYAATGDTGGQVAEFKAMVKELHEAGIEVLLDVVYNHTAEGGPGGPTLSLRGLADGAYYRQDEAGRYEDATGCGNTLAVAHPMALRLVMDSLRYWVSEMHVDGFRFDLASALLRTKRGVDLDAPLLTALAQDPVLRDVKLIAEPWDATAEGYLVGQFPSPWSEWNDRFRDTVRDFWRARSGGVRDLAYRLSGSSDLYADDGRLPSNSINFVTAHDGFTLRDLVSYDHKHNEDNRERNRDGHGDNRSWNCGVEGEADDPAVVALRQRQAANLLATLLLSTGVPMLTAGDERGRTQRGHTNAYCHDSELTWVDWAEDPRWAHLTTLTVDLLALRRRHPVLRARHYFVGHPVGDGRRKDLAWLHPAGREMTHTDWFDTGLHTIGMLLNGEPHGDRSFVLWLHSSHEPVTLVPPGDPWPDHWEVVVDTSGASSGSHVAREHKLQVPGRSLLLMRSM
ncbi:glycogen debranching protein GlgX [soil metagenome]